jgi:hypothetical protein
MLILGLNAFHADSPRAKSGRYAFNHSEAQRAFRKAQKLDPDCAMCFWGEALVLGPNINLPMQEDAVAPARAAAEKAGVLASKATPRE